MRPWVLAPHGTGAVFGLDARRAPPPSPRSIRDDPATAPVTAGPTPIHPKGCHPSVDPVREDFRHAPGKHRRPDCLGRLRDRVNRQRLIAVDADQPVSIQLHDTVGDTTIPVSVRQVQQVAVPGGTARGRSGRCHHSSRARRVRFDGLRHRERGTKRGTVAQIQVQQADNTDDFGSAASIYSVSASMPEAP